jgi:uncharacterized protein (DUF433 family)
MGERRSLRGHERMFASMVVSERWEAYDQRVYPVPIASVLSGASKAQLSYWRKEVEPLGALLIPQARQGRRLLYTVADVIALRSIVYLREEKSLPRIRRAVAYLKAIEEDDWTHLADYRLVRTSLTIYLERPNGVRVDLEARPGQGLTDERSEANAPQATRRVLMGEVLAPFESGHGVLVPDFFSPREHVTVDRDVLGGFPVMRGTRIPFDAIADLVLENASVATIARLYPTVSEAALPSAREFAELVAAAS